MAGEVWGRIVFVTGGRSAVVGLGTGSVDLAVVAALARLQLAARRLGGTIEVAGMSGELAELLDLVGLRREFEREAEEPEDVLGVEEGLDPGDPIP